MINLTISEVKYVTLCTAPRNTTTTNVLFDFIFEKKTLNIL